MAILYCTGINHSGWQSAGQDLFRRTSVDASAQQNFSDLNEYACEVFLETSSTPAWSELEKSYRHKAVVDQVLKLSNSNQAVTWFNQTICLNLPFWQASAESARFLMFYSSPESTLAYYLARHPYQPEQVEAVLINWLQCCRAMLAFQMKNPKKSILVDTAAIAQNQVRFNELIFNLSGIKPETGLKVDTNQLTNSVLLEYLGNTLSQEDSQVAQVFDELRSVASLLVENDRTFPNARKRSSSLVTPFLETVSLADSQQKQYQQLAEEKTLLKSQQAVLETEMEYYFKQQLAQQETIKTLTAEHEAQLQRLSDDFSAEIKKLKHENEQLKKRLSQVEQKNKEKQLAIGVFETEMEYCFKQRLTQQETIKTLTAEHEAQLQRLSDQFSAEAKKKQLAIEMFEDYLLSDSLIRLARSARNG